MRDMSRAIIVLPVPGLPENTMCSDMSTVFRPFCLRRLYTVTMLIRLLTSRLTPSRPISSLSSAFKSSMFSGGVSSSASGCAAGAWAGAADGAGEDPLTEPCFGAGSAGFLGAGGPQMSSARFFRLLLTSVLITSIWVRMISSRLSIYNLQYKGYFHLTK